MRREVFEQVGGFDPGFSAYEDWDFWLHALANNWYGENIDTVTLMYRRHGYTMNSQARANYRGWYRKLRRKHAQLYDRGGRRRLATDQTWGPSAARSTGGGGEPARCRHAWRRRCKGCSGEPARDRRREGQPHRERRARWLRRAHGDSGAGYLVIARPDARASPDHLRGPELRPSLRPAPPGVGGRRDLAPRGEPRLPVGVQSGRAGRHRRVPAVPQP